MVRARQKAGSHGTPEGDRISGTDARARACEQKNLAHYFPEGERIGACSKKCEQKKSGSHSRDWSSEPTLGG